LRPGLEIPLPEIKAKTASPARALRFSGKTVFVVAQLSGFFETDNLKRVKFKLEIFKVGKTFKDKFETTYFNVM
jgi:hypothetical protein